MGQKMFADLKPLYAHYLEQPNILRFFMEFAPGGPTKDDLYALCITIDGLGRNNFIPFILYFFLSKAWPRSMASHTDIGWLCDLVFWLLNGTAQYGIGPKDYLV
jgi:hypothetical protein